MNKTAIMNIINEQSKHIKIVKIDGKDNIAYSSEFVKLLESIPTMLTKDDVRTMLKELQTEINEQHKVKIKDSADKGVNIGIEIANNMIQAKINALEYSICEVETQRTRWT